MVDEAVGEVDLVDDLEKEMDLVDDLVNDVDFELETDLLWETATATASAAPSALFGSEDRSSAELEDTSPKERVSARPASVEHSQLESQVPQALSMSCGASECAA